LKRIRRKHVSGELAATTYAATSQTTRDVVV
jgi:hypothetical protein